MQKDEPIFTLRTSQKPNGTMKTEKLYSYAALLTYPGPDHVVHAVRMDGYQNKYDAIKEIAGNFPGAKVKMILKLYESDFWEDEA